MLQLFVGVCVVNLRNLDIFRRIPQLCALIGLLRGQSYVCSIEPVASLKGGAIRCPSQALYPYWIVSEGFCGIFRCKYDNGGSISYRCNVILCERVGEYRVLTLSFCLNNPPIHCQAV